MKKLLLVNTSINTGSTGRIAEGIGRLVSLNDFECYAAYGVKNNSSELKTIRIGSVFDRYVHAISSRMMDAHGLASKCATKHFIAAIEHLAPDLINLHNIHGYYLNIEILFNFLGAADIPIVWTLHDCWPFTGHCSYFDAVECNRWKQSCYNCPNLHGYPASLFYDGSKRNYRLKQKLFRQIKRLVFVAPCSWMADVVQNSFMKDYPVEIIHNGVDLSVFRPITEFEQIQFRKRFSLNNKRIYLGVANVWDKRKGLNDFLYLSEHISPEERIVLIGLKKDQQISLPHNILGISRTENIRDLAAWYSVADVFVNPTYVDNFPTTNIEALACGTPVVTYRTGGSPEAIDIHTGMSIKRGDLDALLQAIRTVGENAQSYAMACRCRAENYFDQNQRYIDYLHLFQRI